VDSFFSNSTVCRNVSGICDVPENCTGTNATCPVDGFKNSSVTCRPSAGVCDVPDQCTGSNATCPSDAFLSSSTVCRKQDVTCDTNETCTGTTACCPLSDVDKSPRTYVVIGQNSIFYSDSRLPDGSAEDSLDIPIPDCANYVIFNSTGFLNYTTSAPYQFTPQGNTIAGLAFPLAIAVYSTDQGISGYNGPRIAQLGVFVGNVQTTPGPATLDFTSTNPGTQFPILNPLLQQVFYIGNGYSANYSTTTGLPTTTRTIPTIYNIPPGATTLRLGIAISPGYYATLSGFYSTTVQFQT